MKGKIQIYPHTFEVLGFFLLKIFGFKAQTFCPFCLSLLSNFIYFPLFPVLFGILILI